MLQKEIKSLRQKKGWSQAELARRLHISPSAVGMYEQGRRVPSIDILVAMSEEFGVSLDYLVTRKECNLTDSRHSEGVDNVLDAFSVLKDLSREELMILVLSKLMDS